MNENDILVRGILDRTFFKAWRKENINDPIYQNHASLEMQISSRCDQRCSYCYYTKFREEIFPESLMDSKKIYNNAKILLNWLFENEFYPKIEPFSGEIFSQNIGFDVADLILDYQIRANPFHKGMILIPTNFSFIGNPKRLARVTKFLQRAKDNDVDLRLSASIDGKIMDEYNRPFRSGKIRDDSYYNDVFSFAKEWGIAFHPMVYSNRIEHWIENFDWFQEMFSKHGIRWSSIYLLEVRNQEWTRQQIQDYYKFMRYVVRFIYKISGIEDPRSFMEFVYNMKIMNVFSNFFKIGRGSGCSVQSTIQMRLADLTHNICHRASYKTNQMWRFKVDNEKISGIEAINPGLFVAWSSVDEDNFPYCELCAIKYICTGQCWGSMFETNQSLFTPVPTVCLLEHSKIAALVDGLDEVGSLSSIYEFCEEIVSDSVNLYITSTRR